MPINIGKNLKIQPTNDAKVSKFVRSYNKIYDYIEENYQDETQNISLYDLLTSMLNTCVISYINVPTGATFIWKIGSQTLTNPATVYSGQVIEYELIYSDNSKCVGSFTVDDDYILNVNELEPNQFLVTITSDKPLKYLSLYRHYQTDEQTSEYITSFPNNSYTFYADKNEKIYIINLRANGWSHNPETPDTAGIMFLTFTITDNFIYNAEFPYESWYALSLYTKDENGNNYKLSNSEFSLSGPEGKYRDATSVLINFRSIYAEKYTTITYNINVSGYTPISKTYTFNSSNEVYETLVPYCTYTLTPIPADATVTLAASGYNTVSGVGPQSITVEKGTTVMWMIEKEDYETGNGTTTVTTNPQSETQEIEKRNFKVNIDDYEYTFEDGILKLTKYVGTGTTPTTPGLENI